MRAFGDIPIKQKLIVLIMATTAAALLLTGLGVVIFDTVAYRSALKRDLSTLAQITAENSTAALAFNDAQSASETLAALHARTHLVKACIYRLDGTVLASYTRPGVTSGCPSAEAPDELRFRSGALMVSRGILLSDRPIGTLVMLYDLAEIDERIKLYSATVAGVLLVSSLLAFLLSSKLSAIITAPIFQLVRATTSVSQTSDYSIRAEKQSNDELGVLVGRFNEMLAGIQSRDANLNQALLERGEALREAEKARERLRFMAESMPQKIFTALPDGDTDYLNRQWTEFTGLALDQIQNWGWAQFVHPDDLDSNIQAWRHSLETGEPFHYQHRFRRADGVYRWHLSRALAMRNAGGQILLWIGSCTDIHEQKETEEELRRVNDDLQQFAYSASHDLQEPIRNVAVYSQIVSNRYHALLDAEGQQFLGFLTEGGRRLAKLVDDLLAYTRAGAGELNPAAVESSAVLEDALASLAETIRESDAQVTYDPLPEVYMGATHLQQLFQNLISNGLKYRNQNAPRIHISAVKLGAAWRFSVQDNGIGLDAKYKEVIFGVFKRLHRDQKYTGTGIGLAICQRVVERYGGRIWVESESGKGATFFFTVPEHAPRIRSAALTSSVG